MQDTEYPEHASKNHQTVTFWDGLHTELATSFPNLGELILTTLSE